ncbi:MAG: hypothetical protein JWP12_1249 [Bacteroidetes bacterium]|nr:hypothetical protein [Bacteroidota bacterium]
MIYNLIKILFFFSSFDFMSKRYTLLLSFVLILFVALYGMLCYYSRLATDDYYFIWDVRHHGIITGVTSQYMEWCGRFAATFLMDVIYKILDVHQAGYILFPFVSFLLLIAGIYKLMTNAAVRLDLKISRLQTILLSISFTALLYFLSIDIAETWFWYCSLTSYLWSVIAFVWGLAFLFSKGNNAVAILFSSLCFIYVGGSSEVYSMLYGILFLIFIIYRYKQANNFKAFISNFLNRRLLIVYSILGISFIIFLIAPGNYLRDELFPKHQFAYSFFITAKSIVKFTALYLPFRLIYIVIFAIPFIVAGQSLSKTTAPDVSLKMFFTKATLLLMGLLLIFFYTVAYVMVETGPPRIWFIVSFLLAVYSSCICFYCGYTGFFNDQKINILKYGGLFLGCGIMIFHIINQYPVASVYAKAHDERITSLTRLNNTLKHDTIIVVNPLPRSGMLYSSEIQTDTSHFTNKELRLGYELKFHVISK